MSEYAPVAIQHLFDTVQESIPAAVMGGIVGDPAHTYGYHRGRNYLPPDDYSVQSPPDRKGPGEAASALDISWSKEGPQYDVSRRLLDAKNDSRMYCIREFYGSVDGKSVIGWDYYYGRSVTSDDTHLWHIHLSVLREFCENESALQQVADVIVGRESDDLNKQETMTLIEQAIKAYHNGGTYGPWNDADYGWISTADNGMGDRVVSLEKRPDAIKEIERFGWSYHFGEGGESNRGRWTHENYPSLIGEQANGVDDRLRNLES